MRVAYRLLVGLGLCGFLGGCSDGTQMDTAPVQGTVIYNGKPLPYGTVSFQPDAGLPAIGTIQSDGSFTLTTYSNGDGATTGSHKVAVIATEADAGTTPPVDPNAEMPAPKFVIPAKYTSYSTSGLTAEVVEGERNVFTFTILN